MKIENFIESQYRELEGTGINAEYSTLYEQVKHKKLQAVLATLHYHLINLLRTMNERLPTNEYGAHFWAEPSRQLMRIIEVILSLYHNLKNTEYSFEIDEYYKDLITQCRDFLCSSGGSTLPPNMPKVELYYVQPIFTVSNVVVVPSVQNTKTYEEKMIGGGSYANVYKYRDTFYNRNYAIKRAKKDLTEKELLRFKREFEEMQEFSSPYILEVYCYNDSKNEYIMEFMDYTLDEYIAKNNAKMTLQTRKGLILQILRAFEYIHSKDRLHRDVSPKNILIKEYDDVAVAKVADFGLIKIPDSDLTSVSTEFKGYFNDPGLKLEGFNTYKMEHETYALTLIVFYVLTGKTNVEKISDEKLRSFVHKGLNPDKTKRYKDASAVMKAFRELQFG